MSRVAPETLRPLRVRAPAPARKLWNGLVIALCTLCAALILLPLALIVGHLLARGLAGLTLGFFVHLPTPVGEPGGGMANAIVGTFILAGLASLMAVPVGVGAGVWLAEYGRGRLGGLVRYTADVMSGVPSIVVGVAAYGLVVVPMGRFSALAGSVALALLMLPTIIRSTEEVVRLVPRSYREAALALGAPQWRVIQQVVVPAASGGIVTASLLALARAAGETAPLLFTALGNRFWSLRIDQPMASLPVYIFDYAKAPYEDWNRQAWTGALVLLIMVSLVSGLLRLTTRRLPRR
ncbi:MAG: phosphate ABC transporter permease PstA [Candidatus Eisenbacteria bacterium]|uniref:Phosphate transport system permease protein PstA n=1 Tax=Eiseniibacteriota bacterium TaxID=2212470 RepID=A0A538UAC1_UNCEI|nr:MAG: phosphate ABC transporter permease PstA [Candidatus Eisenbacteria bacterium]